MGSIIKMLAAGTGGSQSALAQLDLPMDTKLVGLQWAIDYDADADDESCVVQLSFRSTFAASNDDRGIISETRSRKAITTSGVYQNDINFYLALPDIPIMGGERLFLHVNATAGMVTNAIVLLHLSSDMAQASVRRR